MSHADLLLEIGAEELPPKSLKRFAQHLGEQLVIQCDKAGLSHGAAQVFASPRRLAVYIPNLAAAQTSHVVEKRGPALKAAFDAQGNPTLATLGFANACQTTVDQLTVQETEKGAWLLFRQEQSGQNTATLLPTMIQQALQQLPMIKPMRWGDHTTVFIRPVHWVVLLFGNQVITTEILGCTTQGNTYGHRFHCPQAIPIPAPAEYVSTLAHTGYVLVDYEQRQDRIREQLLTLAKTCQAQVVLDDALLAEVTGLVEWPVALLGQFDADFLKLPAEIIMTSMKSHQKYFSLCDAEGHLLPNFITIANIDSQDPARVIAGNERVLRARLTDARFFWEADLKQNPSVWLERLKTVIFQKKLGSLHDKAQRISQLAAWIAETVNASESLVQATTQAGLLAKMDLASAVVGEFPELQGIMGAYYAERVGESSAIAAAIREHYLPRFSGDVLPNTEMGCYVAIADKLDTLVGLFGIHQPPSGEKDPFALRRNALGVLRILIEKQIPLDVLQTLQRSVALYGELLDNPIAATQAFDFMLERLRAWYIDRGIAAEVFAAVLAKVPTQMTDFDQRIHSVQQFLALPQASSLIAANKRIRNILKQQEDHWHRPSINPEWITEPAEKALLSQLQIKHQAISVLNKQQAYTEILTILAELQPDIDAFFDQVMVLAKEENIRHNRLSVLYELQQLFLQVADLSLLTAPIS